MAADQRGERNRPIFAATGASADAEDLTLLGQLATDVGTRRVGTSAERGALDAAWLFDGLEFFETDTGITYRARTVSGQLQWQTVRFYSGLLPLPGLSSAYTPTDDAGYRVDGQQRSIEGQLQKFINNTATALVSGDRMFTLPAGSRPPSPRLFTCAGVGSSTMRVRVDTTGLVSLASDPTVTTTYLRLEGIVFYVGR